MFGDDFECLGSVTADHPVAFADGQIGEDNHQLGTGSEAMDVSRAVVLTVDPNFEASLADDRWHGGITTEAVRLSRSVRSVSALSSGNFGVLAADRELRQKWHRSAL